MEKKNDKLKQILKFLPQRPGVYQFFDVDEKLLYVGKARVLKNRVNQYFSKNRYENGKTKLLVKKINDIKYIVTETEFDALLLENSLIKKHQPRFNIQLRDDKTYPWICIKKERFPRVFATRTLIKDGSQYFGPYASVKTMRALLDLIHRMYKTRTCNLHLNDANIEEGKFRVCLEYQIGNCLGPCEAHQTEEEYNANITEIKSIVKGNINGVIKRVEERMMKHAENLEFESAQELKDKIDLLQSYQAKSTVVNPNIHNVDVFTLVTDAVSAFVNFMKINNGAIIQSHTVEVKKKLDEEDEEILAAAIVRLREQFQSLSREIYTSIPLDLEMPNITFTVPQIGEKKKLIEFSKRNAMYSMRERNKQLEKTDPDRHVTRLMNQMKTDLHLKEDPVHIECFDNSNFQGDFAVSACVVFKNGKPSKKDYRHFNIKTVVGPDDYASMTEAVHRRYKRLMEEGEPLPQLIVIDGGKGQLGASLEALELLGLRGKIPIIGIAKRLEEIYFPGDSVPLYLDKRSETLKVIQNLRNEAHRFGITHHRNKRSKAQTRSELHGIKGIGEQTITQLLREFKSVKRVKETTELELAKVIGPAKAKVIVRHFE